MFKQATPLNKKHLLVFVLALLTMPTVASAGLLENTLWTIVVNVFGSFAGLGGLLLNYAIQHYVVAGYEASLVSTINNLWVVMRDIFNLTFIFGLLYIGFKMILDSENSNTRRWLVSLILAALLINFSLYITKVVIDVSNIIAAQIVYSGSFPIEGGNVDISGEFMNSLGIQSLFGYKQNPATGEAAYGLIFGAAILFIVMGFVFAAGGVLLIIRFAVLAIYMILSPLMFLGWVFPQLQGYTNKYWQGFLGRAFFAPIYLLLVYFSYIIIRNVFGTQLQDASYKDLFGQSGDQVLGSFGSTLPPFVLACIFLIASLVIAQRLGAEGAATAVNLGRNISNRAKQVVQRGATRTLRGGAMAATYVPRAGARRASNIVGNRLEQQLNRLQQKEGIIGSLSRTNLAERGVRSTATNAKNAKYGMANTLTQDKEQKAATERNAQARIGADENSKKREAALNSYLEASAMAANQSLDAQQRSDALKRRESMRSEVATRVRNTSDDELSKMDAQDLKQIAEHLSDKQIETLEKSGNFSAFGKDSDIQKLKDARAENTFKDYVTDLDSASSSAEHLGEAIKGVANTIKSISDERLTGMKGGQLADERIAMHLSNDQVKTLRTSGKYTADELSKIEKARESGITKTITQGSIVDASKNANANDVTFQNSQRQNLFRRSPAEVGAMPVSTFTEVQTFDHISPAMLEARLKNGVSKSESIAIRRALESHLGIGSGTLPSAIPQLANNPWAKWEKSNSVHAAQFFA